MRTNSPKRLRETCCSRPLPPQRWQVVTFVPGWTPSPLQVSQVTATSSLTSAVVPRAASTRSISISAGTSAPRAARWPAAAEEVVAEEGGEEVAEAADVEVRRREPARAEAGVPVAVVELRGVSAFESTS